MAKKPATVDDTREPMSESPAVWETSKEWTVGVLVTAEYFNASARLEMAVDTLVNSDIITHGDGIVTWRTGHLEHVANLYKGDPVETARNYADDIAVAISYSADVWEALIANN